MLNLGIAARQELARRNPDSLLDWALAHRFFNGKPMKLTPLLRDLYSDDHPCIVIQKSAQVGISEFLINTAFWTADVGRGGRGNVVHAMPTQQHVDDFSQARYDKAISESAYLQSRLFLGGPSRKELKKLGRGYIYYRGAENRRQLASIDADTVLLDEYDLMDSGVLELAKQRLAYSSAPLLRVASTPCIPEAGINDLFQQSDQHYYYLRCSACRQVQRLEWEHNVDQKQVAIVCRREGCRRPLDLSAPGRWEANAPGNSHLRGYHVSRLYLPTANLPEMIRASQSAAYRVQQEFYNSGLGEPFLPPGGRITIDTLDRCRRNYEMPMALTGKTRMGIDVGARLHVVIRQETEPCIYRAVFIGEVGFPDLDDLMAKYRVSRCVIDGQPETYAAKTFAERWRGKVWIAYYDRQRGNHDWQTAPAGGVATVHANRTLALDELFEGFRQERLELPWEARRLGGGAEVGEYYKQLTALKRHTDQDAWGNWVEKYSDEGRPDHYAHAEVYCLLAAKGNPREGRFGRIRAV